jgi:hypothetical protein
MKKVIAEGIGNWKLEIGNWKLRRAGCGLWLVACGLWLVACNSDHTPPTVEITFPPSGATVGERVNVTADATDNRAVHYVDFYIDGAIACSDSVAPYGFAWTTAMLPDSTSHTIYAKAYDYAKNQGMSTVITVLVLHGKCIPEVLAVKQQTAVVRVESTASFEVRAIDPNGDSTWARLAWGDGDTSTWCLCRDSGWTDSIMHTWHTAAKYTLMAQARDVDWALSGWSAACSLRVLAGSDQPPVAGPPAGPDTGVVQTTCTFVSTPTDPDGDSVRVRFAWGDGDTSNWGPLKASGMPDTGTHSWTNTGTFLVAAEAMDADGLVSLNWGQSWIVIAPENGAGTHHGGEIDTNETWSPSGNPQIIDSTTYVDKNATLTIRPGCIVKFNRDVELQCGNASSGAIIAVGAPDSIILFTSNAAIPNPGDWRDVGMYQHAMATTQFMYCTFEYGGTVDSGFGEAYVVGNDVTKIDHCKIWQSGDFGVVYASANSGLVSLTYDTITSCAQYPIDVSPPWVGAIGAGNVLTGNAAGCDAILVESGTGNNGVTATTTWLNPGVPYVLNGRVEVNGASGPVLTIAPGNTVKLMNNAELYCGYDRPGGIVADGAAGQILFTSAQSSQAPGDWSDIGFYDKAVAPCTLAHCKIEYGGDNHGNVYCDNSAVPIITRDSIGWSSQWGVYLYGAKYPDTLAIRTGNVFYHNTTGNIHQP